MGVDDIQSRLTFKNALQLPLWLLTLAHTAPCSSRALWSWCGWKMQQGLHLQRAHSQWTAGVLGQVAGSCLVLSCFWTETACASALFCYRVIPEGLSAGAEGTAIDMSSVVDVPASFSSEELWICSRLPQFGKRHRDQAL